jgi:CheY-like chemotaxis protein
MKSGPIIILEDDADDKGIIEEVLQELGVKNKLYWFTNSNEVFKYLKNTSDQPFIIFSDVNLPAESGVEFKKRVDSDHELRKKSIPFVFYSTSVDQKTVNDAYTKMTVQGFFQKNNSYSEVKETIKTIIDYWMLCKHPNS